MTRPGPGGEMLTWSSITPCVSPGASGVTTPGARELNHQVARVQGARVGRVHPHGERLPALVQCALGQGVAVDDDRDRHVGPPGFSVSVTVKGTPPPTPGKTT